MSRQPSKTDLLVGYEAFGISAFLLHDLLSEAECNFIIHSVHAGSGMASDLPNFKQDELDEELQNLLRPGPVKHTAKGEGHNRKDRFLFGSEELSVVLWNRMKPFIDEVVGEGIQISHGDCTTSDRFVDPCTGLAQHRINFTLGTAMTPQSAKLDMCDLGLTSGEEWLGEWRPAFCNPIFEVMSYPNGGCFRPHIDANLRYMERIHEMQNEFKDTTIQCIDSGRMSSRSLYTIVVYLTGRADGCDETSLFRGGETNLLENSYNEKLLYTDDEGNFCAGRKRVFAKVIPERGAALVFYQKGLLHEGADIVLGDASSSQSNLSLNRKIILRSDVFFDRANTAESCNLGSKVQDQRIMISEADRERANKFIEESEEYEEAGDFETAAEIYQKAMAILQPRH